MNDKNHKTDDCVPPMTGEESSHTDQFKIDHRSQDQGNHGNKNGERKDNVETPHRRGGYMRKKGQTFGFFRKRYFSLDEGMLSNYLSEASSAVDKIIKNRETKQIHLKGYHLQIQQKKRRFILQYPDKTMAHAHYVLEIKDQTQFNLWQIAFQAHFLYANGNNDNLVIA